MSLTLHRKPTPKRPVFFFSNRHFMVELFILDYFDSVVGLFVVVHVMLL